VDWLVRCSSYPTQHYHQQFVLRATWYRHTVWFSTRSTNTPVFNCSVFTHYAEMLKLPVEHSPDFIMKSVSYRELCHEIVHVFATCSFAANVCPKRCEVLTLYFLSYFCPKAFLLLNTLLLHYLWQRCTEHFPSFFFNQCNFHTSNSFVPAMLVWV
jgi:hypothetical protein